MSHGVLPKEMQYETMNILPSGITNSQVNLLPINGSTFECNGQNIIQWQIPSVGFMQPDSLFLKYNYAVTCTGESTVRSVPVFAPIQRSQVFCGSQSIENITNYNVVMHMMSNLNLSIAQKYGLATMYGYQNSNRSEERRVGKEC